MLQILVENCVKVLQDYSTQTVKFDYVINDLSEYLLDTDTGSRVIHLLITCRHGFTKSYGSYQVCVYCSMIIYL